MSGDTLGWIALAVVAISLGGWIRGVMNVTLEGRRGVYVAGFGVGFVLSVASFVQGTGLLAGGAALFSLLASTVFLGLTALSAQTPNTPSVAVGGPVVDFTAPADDGTLFDSATLRGRPFLLKFFRGHW